MLIIPDNRKIHTDDVYIEDTAWVIEATRALNLIQDRDYVVTKAVETGRTLNPDWLAWREHLRRVVRGDLDAIGDAEEPERYTAAPDAQPQPAAPEAEPDENIIPDELASYALADEAADDFRRRAFNLLFRFGIADGENFEGGGEPLTADEKINLLPMLIANFEAGNWLNLSTDLRPA